MPGPRRPGHTTSCPTPDRRPDRCVCRSERIAAPDPPTDDWPPPIRQPSTVGPGPALVACPSCYAPTSAGEPHTCRW